MYKRNEFATGSFSLKAASRLVIPSRASLIASVLDRIKGVLTGVVIYLGFILWSFVAHRDIILVFFWTELKAPIILVIVSIPSNHGREILVGASAF